MNFLYFMSKHPFKKHWYIERLLDILIRSYDIQKNMYLFLGRRDVTWKRFPSTHRNGSRKNSADAWKLASRLHKILLCVQFLSGGWSSKKIFKGSYINHVDSRGGLAKWPFYKISLIHLKWPRRGKGGQKYPRGLWMTPFRFVLKFEINFRIKLP